jgi:hypothetical protein
MTMCIQIGHKTIRVLPNNASAAASLSMQATAGHMPVYHASDAVTIAVHFLASGSGCSHSAAPQPSTPSSSPASPPSSSPAAAAAASAAAAPPRAAPLGPICSRSPSLWTDQ